MKLRNKLIPLMSVVSAASVVAPLTACGNVSTSSMNMIDVLSGYVPSIEKAPGSTTLTEKQVEDLYIQAIKQNPDIFAQDLAWWEGMATKVRIYEAAYGVTGINPGRLSPLENEPNPQSETKSSTRTSFRSDLENTYNLQVDYGAILMLPKTAKFGISDLKINQVTLVNPTTLQEVKVNTISLKFNYDYEFDLVADAYCATGRYTAKRTTKAKLTSEYKNVPFTVEWDSGKQSWIVETSIWKSSSVWMSQKLLDWSFDFDLAASREDTITDYHGNVDTYYYDDSMGGYIDTYAKLRSWIVNDEETNEGHKEFATDSAIRSIVFSFGSFHLYDMMPPRWTVDTFGYRGQSNNWWLNSSFQYSTNWYSAIDDSWFGIGNIGLNFSYLEVLSGQQPKSIKLALTSDLEIPVYANSDTEETIPTYYISIKNENNKNMVYDKDGETAWRVGLYCQLLDDKKQPLQIGDMMAEFGVQLDVILNNYHWTFPIESIPVIAEFDEQYTKSTTIPLGSKIVMPWGTGISGNEEHER